MISALQARLTAVKVTVVMIVYRPDHKDFDILPQENTMSRDTFSHKSLTSADRSDRLVPGNPIHHLRIPKLVADNALRAVNCVFARRTVSYDRTRRTSARIF